MKIRIGGVPEHFNYPIHNAINNGNFKAKGLEVQWTTFDGGTGQMTKALRNGEIDICILLTEGIITDIIKGNPSKIISIYVNTPLIWGVHTGAKNELNHYDEIFDKKFAISRFGSGSHLMPIVDANSNGKTINRNQFEVIKNLDGALKSLANLESDVFYWEKYTTSPFVKSGELRRIGEYVTPWPCFVIAATNQIINQNPKELSRILRVIHDSCDQFMLNSEAINIISQKYNIEYEDAERWFHSTEWATHGWVSDKMVKSVLFNLKTAGIVDEMNDAPEIIWKRE
jgi:ABC-type nitrate/sulfonate/bicarbonate transport system substrate-binding protein